MASSSSNSGDTLVGDDEDYEDLEEEEAEEVEDEDEDYVPLVRGTGLPQNPPQNSAQPAATEESDQDNEEEVAISHNAEEEKKEAASPRNDHETFSCSICMEPWSSQGHHRICVLVCGHLYGRSCIERWIRQCQKNTGKCPQCNEKCKLKDIIDIYAPRVAVVDDDLQKEVISLRAENDFLKMERASLLEEIRLNKKRVIAGGPCEKQKSARLGHVSFGGEHWRPSEYVDEIRGSQEPMTLEHILSSQNSSRRGSSTSGFLLKDELQVDGARVFVMDAFSQTMIISRRPSGMDGMHVLTKISLLFPYESENIPLPPSYKAVRDICISRHPGKLALFTSMGKKLSILSTESNNIVLTYDLLVPAWSCSWDFNHPHHVYAGLQNGMLLMFDLRQTARPMESLNGLTRHPVHTIHSLVHNTDNSLPSGVSKLITASSIGPCHWNIGLEESPYLIPEMGNQGVCISLAYCGLSNDIVATFRPRVQIPSDGAASLLPLSASPTVSGPAILGSHILVKRVGGNLYQNCGFTTSNVSELRMPKSAIIGTEVNNQLFVHGDELTCGLCVRDLPSLSVLEHLKPHQHSILDVKYAPSTGPGLLGCISENKLQLFACPDH